MAHHGSGLKPSFAVGRVFKVMLLLKVTSGSLLWDSGDLVADGAFGMVILMGDWSGLGLSSLLVMLAMVLVIVWLTRFLGYTLREVKADLRRSSS